MQPSHSPTSDFILPLAVGLLTAIMVLIAIQRRETSELRDHLRIERDRRQDAEQLARDRSHQMDGALEKIHQLQSDDPERTGDDD